MNCRVRESLRLSLIQVPRTDDNDTYSDGYASGLADAIDRIKALCDKADQNRSRNGFGAVDTDDIRASLDMSKP